eukprot:scaffold3346_cov106-Isochrysis_galbana.AAC.1
MGSIRSWRGAIATFHALADLIKHCHTRGSRHEVMRSTTALAMASLRRAPSARQLSAQAALARRARSVGSDAIRIVLGSQLWRRAPGVEALHHPACRSANMLLHQ